MIAMIVVAEFEDFERFSGGRKVSCWVGVLYLKTVLAGMPSVTVLLPKQVISTYAAHLPKHSALFAPGKDPTKYPPKENLLSSEITATARRGNKRIFARYHHLKDDLGKHANKAKIACVSELARWCWVIGRMVEREQNSLP